MQVDRQGNVYAADRGNRRIQVFDKDGNFLRFIFLNVPYDKSRRPVLGSLPTNRPDETAPWTLCITTSGPTQYLFAVDSEPGRICHHGREILGWFGESGRQWGQFNWPHGLACPRERAVRQTGSTGVRSGDASRPRRQSIVPDACRHPRRSRHMS
jgi:hypothetical protein